MEIKGEPCIFCGDEANTREHIPAKQFFKGVPEKDLVTVPSCSRCNAEFQKDEDFFRQFWVSMLLDKSQKARQMFDDEITRSIKRRPSLGFQMFSQMKLIDLHTKSGEYLGKKTAYKISDSDGKRIDRVVNKIVKGIFFHEFKRTIPESWEVKIFWITPKLEREQKLIEMARTLRWNVIKEDTFVYGINNVPKTFQSVLIIDFFKTPLFYVFVMNKKASEKDIKSSVTG